LNDDRVVAFRANCYQLPRELWWPYEPPRRKLPMDEVSLVTFEVETSSGITGMGYTQNRGGGIPVQAALDSIVGPQLIGRSTTHPNVVWDQLQPGLARLGPGGVAALALSAADIAMWDASAIGAGLPLHEHLGSRRQSVPAYGSSFDRLYSDEDFLETAAEYVGAGMTAVKMRVGLSSERDRHRLQILRDASGRDLRIMVDANSNWNLPEALRRLPMLEEFEVDLLEEPITPSDADGFAEIQSHTTIPIAGGENLYTTAEFVRFLHRGSLRLVQPDIGRIGGVTGWMRVAQLAEAYNLPISAHLMQEVSVHVMCAVKNAWMLEYAPILDPIFETPLAIAPDGSVAPPTVPGTGVRFRKELIEPYRI